MIRSNIKNSCINLIYLCFVIFYEEIIFSISTLGNMGNVILKVLFAILIALVMLTIIQMCSPKFSKKLLTGIIVLIPIIFCIYFMYYALYGQVLSIYSIYIGTQAFEFTSTILDIVLNNWHWLLMIVLPIFLHFSIFNKKIYVESIEFKNVVVYISLFVFIYGLSIGFMHILPDKNDIYKVENIYYTGNNHIKNLEHFGLLTTIRLDIQNSITNFKEHNNK